MPIADRIWPLSISTRIGYCHLTTESPSARWIFAYTRQPTKVSRKRSCSDAAQIGFFEVSNFIASWFFVLVLVLSVSGTRTRCGIFEYDAESSSTSTSTISLSTSTRISQNAQLPIALSEFFQRANNLQKSASASGSCGRKIDFGHL